MLHPVTHESVIWISGRTYPLASLFSLAAIAWILQRANRRPSPTDHLVLVSLVIGALLSYEAALILPLLLMPVMVTSRGGGDGRYSGSRRGWPFWPISRYAMEF